MSHVPPRPSRTPTSKNSEACPLPPMPVNASESLASLALHPPQVLPPIPPIPPSPPPRTRDLTHQASMSTCHDSVTIVSRASLDTRNPDEDDVNLDFQHEAYGPKPGEKDWDAFEVSFPPGSSEDPHNWSRARRWYITSLAGLLVLNAYVQQRDLFIPRVLIFPFSAPLQALPQLVSFQSSNAFLASVTK